MAAASTSAWSVAASDSDAPRSIKRSVLPADRVFRSICAGAAMLSLLIIGSTAFFLAWNAAPVLHKTGVWSFLSTSVWTPGIHKYGVWGLLLGTVMIAVTALAAAVPVAIGLALFINEYAPAKLRSVLVSAVDLLAALPSIIYGMFGFFVLLGPLKGIALWLTNHLSAIPFLRVDRGVALTNSPFDCGVIVALMIVPIITSVSRDVMAQCPREQCEGALALGGSRWGMIREVILPFSRSGVVGAALLGFGRALGETIAITIIIAFLITPNTRILSQGGGSIAALIATHFGEAQPEEIKALVAAGLALFVVTLFVNLGARRIVARARSAV